MMTLSQTQIDTFKIQLKKLQAELGVQYEMGKSATETVVLDQSKVGRLSRMDAMQQQKMAESNFRNTEARLRKISIALAKIDSGDFSFCDECGETIAAARLQVQPEAPLCLDCQTKSE